MKRPYNPDNDFSDVPNIERLRPSIIAEALIDGRSARALDMLGRAEAVERLAPSLIPVGFIRCIKCGRYLAKADFSPDKRKVNGAHSYCRYCRASDMNMRRGKR